MNKYKRRLNGLYILLSLAVMIFGMLLSIICYMDKEMREIEAQIDMLDIELKSGGRPTAGVTNYILKDIDLVSIKPNEIQSVGSSEDSNNKDNKNINEEIKVNPEASEGLQNEYEELEEPEIIEEPEPEFIEVESTAYYNKYNRKCADGTTPYYGVLAGKIEWLGKKVDLYNSDKEYIGEFTFHDTGYGQSTGHGSSKILKDRSLGTIETGQCIDIFMSTYSQCINYGRRKVYIVFKDE